MELPRYFCGLPWGVSAPRAAGRLKVNRHHSPSRLSTPICPPDRLIKTLQMCSPSPLPRVFSPRERSYL